MLAQALPSIYLSDGTTNLFIHKVAAEIPPIRIPASPQKKQKKPISSYSSSTSSSHIPWHPYIQLNALQQFFPCRTIRWFKAPLNVPSRTLALTFRYDPTGE